MAAAHAGDTLRAVAFVADEAALRDPELAILAVELAVADGDDVVEESAGALPRTFRVVPRAVWSVENNLSIGNLDFADFLASLDADGVFRGFPAAPLAPPAAAAEAAPLRMAHPSAEAPPA